MEQNEDEILDVLSNVERIRKLSPEKAQEEFIHIAEQFQTRYRYLIGEWRNSRRAKSTTDGRFVSKQDIIDYLD